MKFWIILLTVWSGYAYGYNDAHKNADSTIQKQQNLPLNQHISKINQRAAPSFPNKISPKIMDYVLKVLQMPLEKRRQLLKKKPSLYFLPLIAIFKSDQQNDSTKWNALMAMTRLSPSKAKPYVLQSLKKRSWYFKNAGLIAMEIMDPSLAVHYAGQFLKHPSLVLRTASVEVIRKQKARQYKTILKEQMHAQHNFRNGVSLWIRPYIAQALAEFASSDDKQFLLSLLTDSDSKLHPIALKALNRLNRETPPPPYKPMVAKEGWTP